MSPPDAGLRRLMTPERHEAISVISQIERRVGTVSRDE
ncbi:hypothetical protein ZBT109_0801 [Zymobacter palmae]|uniref:Uncharacterized protein n=1 Tax=Zymobacter palmae TaxID=33074 RepID=A0A348HD75_9GAMM|nr:hypothetical protein ZBT109_0801 [Zymobacter palmae]